MMLLAYNGNCISDKSVKYAPIGYAVNVFRLHLRGSDASDPFLFVGFYRTVQVNVPMIMPSLYHVMLWAPVLLRRSRLLRRKAVHVPPGWVV